MFKKLIEFLVTKRVFLGLLFAVIFIIFAKPNPHSIFAGFIIAVLGEGLRTWSSGIIKKNKELATTGPYSIVRHPLYLGSFIMGVGVSIMGRRIDIILAFILLFILIYGKLMQQEEGRLKELFSEEFGNYSAKVPAFFPKSFRCDVSEFSWALMWNKHREYRAWLGLAAIAGILVIKYYSS